MTKGNPQIEDGYTPIANEILEALAKTKTTNYQMRVLVFLLRKTYGFRKRDDWISCSQIVAGTGINKAHVSRAKKELLQRKMIVTPLGNKMGFNKHYSQWIELPNGVTHEKLPRQDKKLPRQGHTKETIQKKLTKDRKLAFGELKNVKLSEDEHRKLLEKFGSHLDDKMENLSLYIASTGKVYTSHYATILNWDRKDKKKTMSINDIKRSDYKTKAEYEEANLKFINKNNL